MVQSRIFTKHCHAVPQQPLCMTSLVFHKRLEFADVPRQRHRSRNVVVLLFMRAVVAATSAATIRATFVAGSRTTVIRTAVTGRVPYALERSKAIPVDRRDKYRCASNGPLDCPRYHAPDSVRTFSSARPSISLCYGLRFRIDRQSIV
jgi:hypothetical protein